jgi:dihydroorotate dehydrogenase
VGGRLVLISVGGIETPEDAWARIRAGASLVQAYTGFVYGGPSWPGTINRGLLACMRRDGLSSVQDAIGAGITTDDGGVAAITERGATPGRVRAGRRG